MSWLERQQAVRTQLFYEALNRAAQANKVDSGKLLIASDDVGLTRAYTDNLEVSSDYLEACVKKPELLASAGEYQKPLIQAIKDYLR